jgi:hypothetical protein
MKLSAKVFQLSAMIILSLGTAFVAVPPSTTQAKSESTEISQSRWQQYDEVMTDRCSGEVAFPSGYYVHPSEPGTFILKRDYTGYSEEISILVGTGKGGRIRWYCHSTTGNFLDPGTWVVNSGKVIEKCDVGDGGSVSCGTSGSIGVSQYDFGDWTAEQSRCNNHTGSIVARLGPNRRLTIECMSKN